MLAEHDLIARLMETSHEDEFAAMDRLLWAQPCPAGEDLGEVRHVGLAITTANAERVQFQRLACEILIEAFVLVDARNRIRAHRQYIIEVDQHRWMALHRLQKVGKTAKHVRSNGLALIGAGHCGVLVGGNAKVVRPEPDQSLD